MIQGIFDKIGSYLKIKVQQIKLDLIAHVSKLLSHVIALLLLSLFGFFLLFFLSFTLGVFLNEVLCSPYYGFLIVAGIYFILFFILALLAKSGRIQQWIENLIVKASDNLEEDE